ncbi:MAG: ATP-binding protein [Eubacteriales bacterium]|nr:ATP-binding protein [Eubacteriales bacterium]
MIIKRTMYLKKLEMYVDRNAVKIITGVRRCGKTTLIRQFIDELKENGIPEENIFYINFEGIIYSYFNSKEHLRDMISTFIESINGQHCYIFLDEVECVKGWAQVASELLNLFDCDIYVSSSNKSIFNDDYGKVLGYRYVKIEMYPLTFSEYLEITADEPGHYKAENEAQTEAENEAGESGMLSREELFRDYLKRGCMPGAYALQNDAYREDYLRNLYSAIILKDVVQCNNLRDISHLDKIMEFILNHIGETFSPKGIKDYVKGLGVTISVDTVYSFLDALTGGFLLYKIPRFDIKADRELETQEKYYICDMGMRNAVMGDEGTHDIALIESALCMELLVRGFKVSVGKQNQTQIDFMASRGSDRTYLNCCETIEDKETVKKKFGSLTRIRDNYFKMVLSMDPETKINKGGIINYPLYDFMAQG